MWDNIKRSRVNGILAGKERLNGAEEIIEVIMVEDFLQLMTDTKSQIQEAQSISSRIKIKTYTHTHIHTHTPLGI